MRPVGWQLPQDGDEWLSLTGGELPVEDQNNFSMASDNVLRSFNYIKGVTFGIIEIMLQLSNC